MCSTALIKRARSTDFCRGAHHVLHHLCKIKVPCKKMNTETIAPVLEALEKTHPAVTAPPAALKALTLLKVGV